MPAIRRAVCLFSGGPDAVVAAALARKDGLEEIHTLFVDYGQHAVEREMACAKSLSEWIGAKSFTVTKFDLYSQLKATPMVAAGHVVTGANEYVPFRNTVMAGMAVVLAETLGADTLVIGSMAGPWVTPDNRPEYFEVLNALIDKGTPDGTTLRVSVPLQEYSKTRIIETALALGVPLELTWSCHNNDDVPCLECGNCAMRAAAFLDLGVEDPLTGSVPAHSRVGLTMSNEKSFSTDVLVVSEIFGPTLQGEGPSSGLTATFVRLGYCNLQCGFCDTPYTWDWRNWSSDVELSSHAIGDLGADLLARDTEVLVITGGEPLLQQTALAALLSGIPKGHFVSIEIETNGTVAPSADLVDLVDRFNVSPKLGNAGMSAERRIRPKVLAAFQDSGKAVFKFVASGDAELQEIDQLCRTVDLRPIYVMPEGTTASAVIRGMQSIADGVIRRGWRMTTRSHVLIWGDVRGV